jgi:hypothetical protein
MATTSKAPRKPRAPIHPAILALRVVAAAFAAAEEAAGRTVAALFWSDIKHDEAFIAKNPTAGFAWIGYSLGSQIYGLFADCAAVDTTPHAGAKPWPTLIAEAIEGARVYRLWDGVTWRSYSGPDDLYARMQAHQARVRIDQIRNGPLKQARESLADDWGCVAYRARLTANVAEWEAEITRLEGICDDAY